MFHHCRENRIGNQLDPLGMVQRLYLSQADHVTGLPDVYDLGPSVAQLHTDGLRWQCLVLRIGDRVAVGG